MSLFLGKIHYWLFNKIVWFENLEGEIIKLAKEDGINTDELTKELSLKYGEKLPNLPLEEMIDTSNIHGWLQDKIHSAEYRLASITVRLLEKDNGMENLEELYKRQGLLAAKEALDNSKSVKDPFDIFNAINDYVLDGMPCDRVNEIISNEENKLVWKRRLCVHKDIWDAVGGDVNVFYQLRDLWITTFVSTVNNNFEYKVLGDNNFSIERI